MRIDRGAMVSLVGRTAPQDHADAFDHGTPQAGTGGDSGSKASICCAAAPCPRRARIGYMPEESLPGAPADRGRKHPAAAMGRLIISTQTRLVSSMGWMANLPKCVTARRCCERRSAEAGGLGVPLAIGTRCLLLDEPFEGIAPALSERLS